MQQMRGVGGQLLRAIRQELESWKTCGSGSGGSSWRRQGQQTWGCVIAIQRTLRTFAGRAPAAGRSEREQKGRGVSSGPLRVPWVQQATHQPPGMLTMRLFWVAAPAGGGLFACRARLRKMDLQQGRSPPSDCDMSSATPATCRSWAVRPSCRCVPSRAAAPADRPSCSSDCRRTSATPSQQPAVRRRHTTHAAATATAAAAAVAGSSPGTLPAHSIHILWDLDNISVAHAAHLPLIGRRLMRAVLRHAGGRQGAAPPSTAEHPACQLTAYANERTLARLGGEDAARRALALIGGRLVAVPVRK